MSTPSNSAYGFGAAKTKAHWLAVKNAMHFSSSLSRSPTRNSSSAMSIQILYSIRVAPQHQFLPCGTISCGVVAARHRSIADAHAEVCKALAPDEDFAYLPHHC
jgi:hypothetical protein